MLCSTVVMLLQFRGWQKWKRDSETSGEAKPETA
jgi:hypothetical protein